MAQVDFVNYFSILFWFFVSFIIYYSINYTILLPTIYSILCIRYNTYKYIVNCLKLKINLQSIISIYINITLYYLYSASLLKKLLYKSCDI